MRNIEHCKMICFLKFSYFSVNIFLVLLKIFFFKENFVNLDTILKFNATFSLSTYEPTKLPLVYLGHRTRFLLS